MKTYYFHNPHEHPDFHVGPHHHHECPPPPPHPGCCHHYGKVGIVGKLVLKTKVIDRHGHVKYFDIEEGRTYVIEAISQTKGRCKFTGRIVDFETGKGGTQSVLDPPHEVDISSIIVDYSDNYEAKLIRIGVDNIIDIRPVEKIEDVNPREYRRDDNFINDPFVGQNLSYSIEQSEKELNDNDNITIEDL